MPIRTVALSLIQFDSSSFDELGEAGLRRWRERGTNATDLAGGDRPFYALMMFPYPSAEGLHVGNLFAFTGNDIYGRFHRLRGHTVFEPLGYDAFGLPAENHAIRTGLHPRESTEASIAEYLVDSLDEHGLLDRSCAQLAARR